MTHCKTRKCTFSVNAALRFLNEKYVFFVADDRRWSHQWLRAASVRSSLQESESDGTYRLHSEQNQPPEQHRHCCYRLCEDGSKVGERTEGRISCRESLI